MKMDLKKIVATTLIVLISLPIAATAREKREFSLPEAGDFSIGIDATPIINFAGNVFNNTNDQSLDDLSGSPVGCQNNSDLVAPTVSLLGRYMLTDNVAFRVNFGIIVDNYTDSQYVIDEAALESNPLSEAKVIDSYKTVESGTSIAVGLEYRIGKGRLQGVFSGNFLYMYSVSNTKYNYGNEITTINQTPAISDFSSYTNVASYMTQARELKTKGGSTNTVGLMATAGIEWFVANQISLGFEVDLIAAYSKVNKEYTSYEGYNTSTECVDKYDDLASPASHSFYMGTGCFGSNLTVNFYF